MKLTKLVIKDYHQFKDLELDFTYPEGHPKAGQPLSKVCFIGQNGVGKTKIMELMIAGINGQKLPEGVTIHHSTVINKVREISLRNLEEDYKTEFTSSIKDNSIIYIPDFSFRKSLPKYEHSFRVGGNFTGFGNNIKPSYQYTFNVKTIIDDKSSDLRKIVVSMSEKFRNISEKLIVEKKYEELKLIGAPQKDLFDHFGTLIPNCNFVYSDRSDDGTDILFSIKNPNGELTGEQVSINDLSSGTRQLMYKYLPLFDQKINETFLFVDQPEDSLHPGLQKIIIDIYLSIDVINKTSNQFFFATHSDLIAAQFEPCEIFRLENKEGATICKRVSETLTNSTLELGYLDRSKLTDLIFDTSPTIDINKTTYDNAVQKWYSLQHDKQTEPEVEEIKSLLNGSHPEFKDILIKSNFFSS